MTSPPPPHGYPQQPGQPYGQPQYGQPQYPQPYQGQPGGYPGQGQPPAPYQGQPGGYPGQGQPGGYPPQPGSYGQPPAPYQQQPPQPQQPDQPAPPQEQAPLKQQPKQPAQAQEQPPEQVGEYICRYCRHLSDATATACPRCGAPVDVRASVSDSGWQKQPPIKDMARLQFGQSYCQIGGIIVPSADFALAQGDSIYFSHHTLLWADENAQLGNMPMKGAWRRKISGLDVVMMTGQGPGHIALSDNHAGDIVALPLDHGQQIWVREHRFLVATGTVNYDFNRTGIWFTTGTGDDRETHYPLGYFADTFTAQHGPGLLLLHSPGNTFVRDLAHGESMLIQPSALLYRDLSVRMHLHLEYPRSENMTFFFTKYNYRTVWLRLTGPGRVAVQSVYERPESSERITSHSGATTRQW
ncbi:MAG: AIM24 family protein [Sciscionella sp.]|nr:AIM24 family protein [Sciscionella sp.]